MRCPKCENIVCDGLTRHSKRNHKHCVLVLVTVSLVLVDLQAYNIQISLA
jgi:hypothetical protein